MLIWSWGGGGKTIPLPVYSYPHILEVSNSMKLKRTSYNQIGSGKFKMAAILSQVKNIQRRFTKRVPSLSHLSYLERLNALD